jgi:hypothetical protein
MTAKEKAMYYFMESVNTFNCFKEGDFEKAKDNAMFIADCLHSNIGKMFNTFSEPCDAPKFLVDSNEVVWGIKTHIEKIECPIELARVTKKYYKDKAEQFIDDTIHHYDGICSYHKKYWQLVKHYLNTKL